MSFANFQCCARHLQDPQFDPRLFGTFQEACVLLVKAAVPWGRPIYTANHNGGHELEFDAPFAKVVFLHFAGATIALNQVKPGQACPLMARPATGARAQRGKVLTQLLCTRGKIRPTNPNVSSTKCCLSQRFARRKGSPA